MQHARILGWFVCWLLLLQLVVPAQEAAIPYHLIDFDGDGAVCAGDTVAALWYEELSGDLSSLLTAVDPETELYDLSGYFATSVAESVPLTTSDAATAGTPVLALTPEDVAASAATYFVDPSLSYCVFVRGDTNGDGLLQISDGIFLLNYLFNFGVEPVNHDAADANDDGVVDVTDATILLNYASTPGSPAPSAPFPLAGYDPTFDLLETECFGHLAAARRVAFQVLMDDLNLISDDLDSGVFEEDITGDGHHDLVLNLTTGLKAYEFDVLGGGKFEHLQDLSFPADMIHTSYLTVNDVPCLVAVSGVTLTVYPNDEVLAEQAAASYSGSGSSGILTVLALDDGLLVWYPQEDSYSWLERDPAGYYLPIVTHTLPLDPDGDQVFPDRVVPTGEGSMVPGPPREVSIEYTVAGTKKHASLALNSSGAPGALSFGVPSGLAYIPYIAFHPGNDLLDPIPGVPPGSCIPRPTPGFGTWSQPGIQHIDIQIAKKTARAGELEAAGTNQGLQEFHFPWFHVGFQADNSTAQSCDTIDIGLAQRVCGFSGTFRSVEYQKAPATSKVLEVPGTRRKSNYTGDFRDKSTGIWDFTSNSESPFYPSISASSSSKEQNSQKGTNDDINAKLGVTAVPRTTLTSATPEALLLLRDQPSFAVPQGHNLEWRKLGSPGFPNGKVVAVRRAEVYLRFSDHVLTKNNSPSYYMGMGYRTFGIMVSYTLKRSYMVGLKNLDNFGYRLASHSTGRNPYQARVWTFLDDFTLPPGGGDAYRCDVPQDSQGRSGNAVILEAYQQTQVVPE